MGRPEMFRIDKNRTLEYADLAPLAYLYPALEGTDSRTDIRHLLIDEMQDYSPVQYKIIQKLYPCRKTILADAHQSVNPYGSSTAQTIRQIFVNREIMKLCKSYRSTCEITEFAQKIRRNEESEAVERHGEQPAVLPFKSPEEEIAGIATLLSAFRRSGYKSLGIICKTERQALETAVRLETVTKEAVNVLSSRSSAFSGGIVITSAHMAKGLEFDEVIVPQASAENYRSETERGMLYVAVTRAMHKLSLTCNGPVSPFIR